MPPPRRGGRRRRPSRRRPGAPPARPRGAGDPWRGPPADASGPPSATSQVPRCAPTTRAGTRPAPIGAKAACQPVSQPRPASPTATGPPGGPLIGRPRRTQVAAASGSRSPASAPRIPWPGRRPGRPVSLSASTPSAASVMPRSRRATSARAMSALAMPRPRQSAWVEMFSHQPRRTPRTSKSGGLMYGRTMPTTVSPAQATCQSARSLSGSSRNPSQRSSPASSALAPQ